MCHQGGVSFPPTPPHCCSSTNGSSLINGLKRQPSFPLCWGGTGGKVGEVWGSPDGLGVNPGRGAVLLGGLVCMSHTQHKSGWGLMQPTL